jgi:class 3 adenylate cyclase/tetratricopeptide (TPR) repeat protein
MRTTPADKSVTPESYTPKHLAERILNSKAALEGERKQVTVLFADLKGSMELLADRDPEEARKLLDPVLEHMMEAVHRYEGTVNQVMGDGIMALFGAPLALEDHAVRACYAALRMQDSVRQYAEEASRAHGIAIRIRVGLNTGEVVVRAIGNDLHMDYTAVGQTTHLAARMEQLADPGSVLLAAATYKLTHDYVEAKARGPVPIKGLSEPVEVFDLVGAGATRSRFQAAVVRGLTRFVGRESEVKQLRHAAERAAAGHGQLVAIVGEPGVGKSRLLYEFLHAPSPHEWRILETGCLSYGKNTPHLPTAGLLKAYFTIDDRDDVRTVRGNVTDRLLALDRSLGPTLPALLSLLDVGIDDSDWTRLDPSQRRERMLDGVKRLLIRESQSQLLLVIVEDLHWIDSETQALLDKLVEGLPTARMLLLVNYRPEYTHSWGSKTYYTQVRLDTLPAQNAEELLCTLLGDEAGLQGLKQQLIQRTEGNPLFLEESIRALVDTRALEGERGAFRVTRSLESIKMPATIQGVLASRIDRLPLEQRHVLQVASVIGETAPLALLNAIAEMPEESLRRALGHLQSAEFLYECTLFPDLEYRFKHGLIYQVAYNSLLSDRRRTLHARIADALERLHAAPLVEHVDRLAHHTFRAEQWDRAVQFLRQAGAKAAAQSAYRAAVEHFEHGLEALNHLPESREAAQQRVDIWFALRSELQPLGEHDRVIAYLQRAESLAAALGDDGRLGWASAYLSQYAWITGDLARAEALGQRALTIASAQDDMPLRVAADHVLAQGYHAVGEYRRSVQHCERNVATLTGDRVYERSGLSGLPSVMSRMYLSWCLTELGQFGAALSHGHDALRIAENSGQPYNEVLGHYAIAYPHLIKGSFDGAILPLEGAVETCRKWDLFFFLPSSLTALGTAYLLAGRLPDALPLLEQGATQAGMMWSTNLATSTDLATGYLAAGRIEESARVATRVVTMATDRKARGYLTRALQLLGDISARREPVESAQAEDCYRKVLVHTEELGMRPLTAHCHAGLGYLYQRIRRTERAQEHIALATAMYREMDMDFWLQRMQANMKEFA